MEPEIDALPIIAQEATQTGTGIKSVNQVSIIYVHLLVMDNYLEYILQNDDVPPAKKKRYECDTCRKSLAELMH